MSCDCLTHAMGQFVFLVGIVLGGTCGIILAVLFGDNWIRRD